MWKLVIYVLAGFWHWAALTQFFFVTGQKHKRYWKSRCQCHSMHLLSPYSLGLDILREIFIFIFFRLKTHFDYDLETNRIIYYSK